VKQLKGATQDFHSDNAARGVHIAKIVDTVLKVEKQSTFIWRCVENRLQVREAEHVHMTTRGVQFSQIADTVLRRPRSRARSYDDAWSADYKVEKQSTFI
jgi:hypothetical protein